MLKCLVFCLFAACLLFIGDLGHIHSGIAIYPGEQGPRLSKIPLWVLLEFFLAVLLLLSIYPLRVKIFKYQDFKPKMSFVLSNLLWTLLIYLGTSISEDYIYSKFLGLTVMTLGQLIFLKMNNLASIADLLIVATLGWITEFILGQSNIFVYLPSPALIYTLPAWLPFIYISAAMSVRQAGRYLTNLKPKT